MQKTFDVAIVGASIAGAALAARLAACGIDVALIDKAEFPRRKACGEGMSAAGVRELRDLGIAVDALSAFPFFGYSIWPGAKEAEQIFFADPAAGGAAECGIGIERYHLDQKILELACSRQSVAVFLGESVREVETEPQSFVLKLADARVRCRYLVLADGAQSRLAGPLGFEVCKRGPGRFGASILLEGSFYESPETVHVFLEPGLQVCCTPVSGNRLTMAFLAASRRREVLSERVKLSGLAAKISQRLGFRGEICGRLRGSSSLERIRRPAVSGRVLAVGDCCEQLDPIGGMGMTHALFSARYAAQVLQRVLSGAIGEQQAFAEYSRMREAETRPLRGFTQLTYLSLVGSGETTAGERYREQIWRRLRRGSVAELVGEAAHHSREDWTPVSRCLARGLLHVVGGIS